MDENLALRNLPPMRDSFGRGRAMNQESRYRYERRIKELREENNRLAHYRVVALRIYRETAAIAGDGSAIKCSWILQQFSELLK